MREQSGDPTPTLKLPDLELALNELDKAVAEVENTTKAILDDLGLIPAPTEEDKKNLVGGGRINARIGAMVRLKSCLYSIKGHLEEIQEAVREI